MMSKRLQVWIEGAIFAALAIVLSMIPTNIGSSFTVSLGMIPLTLYAIRRGVKPGLYAGLMWGLLHFLIGTVYFLSVAQVLIEYFLAFTFAGFAGFYKGSVQQALKEGNYKKLASRVVQASLLGAVARFFWHFVAGCVFWGAYAFGGMSPFVFSLVMNGASGLATGVVTGVVLVIVSRYFPEGFVPKEELVVLKQDA